METIDFRFSGEIYGEDYNGFSAAFSNAVGVLQQRLIRSGKLAKPGLCMACGNSGCYVVAHLEDYEAPLEYLPLCYVCHSMLHDRFKLPKMWQAYIEWVEAGNKPITFKSWTPQNWRVLRANYWKGTFAVQGTGGAGDVSFFRMLDVEKQSRCPDRFAISRGAALIAGQHNSGRAVRLVRG